MASFFYPTAPLNTVYVTLGKKFYDSIDFDSGVKLFRDTTFHPEEHAMLEATVVSVPKQIMERADYQGMSTDLQPGDRILMRYDVVYSYVDQPDRDTPIYKNVLLYEGQEYWKADIQKIFGIIREGGITMLNGYVLCDQVIEKEKNRILIVSEHMSPINYDQPRNCDQLRVKYIDMPLQGQPTLPISPGEWIYCIPGVAQAYEINLQPFYILKQSHILGKADNLVKK